MCKNCDSESDRFGDKNYRLCSYIIIRILIYNLYKIGLIKILSLQKYVVEVDGSPKLARGTMRANSLLTVTFIFLTVWCTLIKTTTGGFTYDDFIKLTHLERGKDFRIKYPDDNVIKQSPKRQKPFPKWMPFPCANQTAPGIGRSLTKPTSVHELRPGDIDVIGAMGDSLVAGNGAMEDWAMGTFIENRGISWCAGGQGTWRQYLTVPNILKQFNHNITGYSRGTGEFLSWNSQLNVAFPVSADADALHQARILVQRMHKDPNIDVENDWKMITIFFGANDLCSAQCFGPEDSTPLRHAQKLMQALDYLQRHSPRTFVNLIPVLDVTVSVRIKRSFVCHLLHTMFCSCFHQEGLGKTMQHVTGLVRAYQKAEELLVNSGRYDGKKDFTVVLQPFIKLFNAPLDPRRQFDEVIDISYITHDCFHFSQKGHALAANLLWNNLLEPVGKKSMRKMYVMEKFLCPSERAPYLFTNLNSKKFLETGHQ